MDHKLLLQLLGLVFIAIGLLISYNPEMIINKPIPQDTFQAVERRVWWGLIIGVGILLMFHHQYKPWLLTLAAAGASLTFGILVARFIGIAIDGSVPKQWFWVVVELIIVAAFAFWYFKQRE